MPDSSCQSLPSLNTVDVVPDKEASFQLLLRYSANASVNVRIGQVKGLRAAWFQVGYVWVNAPMGPAGVYPGHHQPPLKPRGWYPDPLLPLPRMKLIANWSMSLWVTIVTNDKHHCPSPDLAVTVDINADGHTTPLLSRSVHVRCHEVQLPARPTMKTAFALHRGCAGGTGDDSNSGCAEFPPDGPGSTGSKFFWDSGGGWQAHIRTHRMLSCARYGGSLANTWRRNSCRR